MNSMTPKDIFQKGCEGIADFLGNVYSVEANHVLVIAKSRSSVNIYQTPCDEHGVPTVFNIRLYEFPPMDVASLSSIDLVSPHGKLILKEVMIDKPLGKPPTKYGVLNTPYSLWLGTEFTKYIDLKDLSVKELAELQQKVIESRDLDIVKRI